MDNLPEIPQEKTQAAYETCVQDPQQMRYYSNAPEGAQQYIALMFYFRVYGHEISDELRQAYLREVESELSTADLVYLIRCERNPEIKEHLTDLLSNHSLRKESSRTSHVLQTTTHVSSPSPASSPRRLKSVAEARQELRSSSGASVPGPYVSSVPPPPPSPPPPPPPPPPEEPPTRRLRTVAEMRQRQPEPEPEPNPAAKAIAEAEARWRRKERLRSLGLFLGKMFHLLVRLIVLAALVAGGWYLWNKFKSGDEDTVLSGPDNGETVLSKNRPSGSASSSPTQTVANAALEEARKQRDKRLAELQRLKDERQISQSRKMAYEALLRKFREARMDYWKNAPAEDRPGKVKEPLTFNCLVPETNSFAILALSCKPDEPMSVQRISPTDDPVELSSDDFKRITADAPYLVMRDERSYFCTPGKLSVITNSVPSSGQLANPSKDTFGALYDLILKLHIKRPDFQWQVSFLPRGFETSIDICSVKFGEMVSRGRFYPKVREAMRIYEENQIRRRAARNTRKAKRPARTVVLYDGDTIRKDIKGVTQVPRTFNYIGSNRHKYSINSYNYNSERRKEEQAREKWTKLYNEAVRQENAERDANRAVETAVSNVEITSQEVEDVLNVGKMIYKAVERD